MGWFGPGVGGTDLEPSADADLIARGGRRVHPPRFAEYAEDLRAFATAIREGNIYNQRLVAARLEAIAYDIAGDNDD
jgi:hypothetical protein